MTAFSFINLLFSRALRRSWRSTDAKVLTGTVTGGLLLVFTFALLPNTPSNPTFETGSGKLLSDSEAIVTEIQRTMPDADPLTIATFEQSVTSLSASDLAGKQGALTKFINGDREIAIAALENVARRQGSAGENKAAANTWQEVGALTFFVDQKRAINQYQNALAIAPDTPGIRNQLGLLFLEQRELSKSSAQFEAILADRQLKGTAWEAAALSNLGILAEKTGKFIDAENLLNRSIALNKQLGRDTAVALQLANLGIVKVRQNRPADATDLMTQALDLFISLGADQNTARIQGILGLLERSKGNAQLAHDWLSQSLKTYQTVGDRDGTARQLTSLGLLAKDQGDRATAADYYQRALKLHQELEQPEQVARQYANLGGIEIEQQNVETACNYWQQALALLENNDASPDRSQIQQWYETAKCQTL